MLKQKADVMTLTSLETCMETKSSSLAHPQLPKNSLTYINPQKSIPISTLKPQDHFPF